MVGNELLMQFQADILDVPVVRPVVRRDDRARRRLRGRPGRRLLVVDGRDPRQLVGRQALGAATGRPSSASELYAELEQGGHPHVRLGVNRAAQQRDGNIDGPAERLR